MADSPYQFLPQDRFIRRINRLNQDPPGRPRPGGFRNNRDRRTSVYLERLIRGQPVPDIRDGDVLAIFPVRWINEINNVRYVQRLLVIEQMGEAHFELVGEMDHRFAVYLKDNAEILTHEQWLAACQL